MEKFMLIFHGGLDMKASPTELQNNMGKWLAWVEKLSKDGKYISGEPLLPGGKLVSGPSAVTDGPFTEGKEVVGGYFIIHASSFEDAIAHCSDYPDYEHGGKVQVRKVAKVDM